MKLTSTQKQALITALANIPSEWRLTPVNGKRAYAKEWNICGNEFSKAQIIAEIKAGSATGYGLILGKNLIAIDFDGSSAKDLYLELSNGESIPENTPSWSSGKDGRCQKLFRVPEQWQGKIQSKKLETGVKGEDGKAEQLEIRYQASNGNGCQSVLPPSIHPDTKNPYIWIVEPGCEILDCPEFILDIAKIEERQNVEVQPVQQLDNLNFDGDKPNIYQFLTKDDRALIDGGVGEGSRDCNGIKLAKNLIGTANKLDFLGIPYEGEPEDIFYQYCERCSPPIAQRDADRIWNSANKGNPSSSLTNDYLLNIWEAFNNKSKKQFSKTNLKPLEISSEIIAKNSEKYPRIKDFQPTKYFNEGALLQWLKSWEFTPTQTQNNRYFQPIETPKEPSIIGIKSPMNTGKSHGQCQTILVNANNGYYSFILTPLRSLNKYSVEKAYSTFNLKIYQLNEDEAQMMLADSESHIILCAESINKCDGYFRGKDIHIDEADQLFYQILSGRTIQGRQQGLALAVLRKAFNECRHIYLYSATLTDKEVELVHKLAPNKPVIKVENTYKFERKHPVVIYEGVQNEQVKIHDKSAIVSGILESEKPFFSSDSKIFVHSLELLLQSSGKYGFALTVDSSEQTWTQLFAENSPEFRRKFDLGQDLNSFWAEDFKANPREFIFKYQPDFFGHSPSLNSGISIETLQDEISYFAEKYITFFGVFGSAKQLQQLLRLRDDIPTFLYCPERSVVPDNDEKAQRPQQIHELLINQIKANSEIFDNSPELNHLSELALIRLATDLNSWWSYYFELLANKNFEKANLRACLSYHLKGMGFDVEIRQNEFDKETQETLKATKDLIKSAESNFIYNAQPFADMDEAEKVKKKCSDKYTNYRYQKTKLLHYYPGIEKTLDEHGEKIFSPDYILQTQIENRTFTNELKNYYLLFNELTEDKKCKYDRYMVATCEFVTLQNLKRDTHSIIQGLKTLGVDELIKKLIDGLEIHKRSEEVLKIVETIKKNKILSRLSFFKIPKTTVSQDFNMKFIQKILNKVGVYLVNTDEKLIDGVKYRFYGIDFKKFNHPYRLTTLECIARYFDENWIPEKYEKAEIDKAIQYSLENDGERKPGIFGEDEQTQQIQNIVDVQAQVKDNSESNEYDMNHPEENIDFDLLSLRMKKIILDTDNVEQTVFDATLDEWCRAYRITTVFKEKGEWEIIKSRELVISGF